MFLLQTGFGLRSAVADKLITICTPWGKSFKCYARGPEVAAEVMPPNPKP